MANVFGVFITPEWIKNIIQTEIINITNTGVFVEVGTILTYAGVTAPNGYYLCQGQPISVAANADLYAVIGTLYNPTNLVVDPDYFHVPDLRGVYMGMPGTNQTSHYEPSLSDATLSGPSGLGNYQLQQTVFIDHRHTSEYPDNTSKVPNLPQDISVYRSGSSQYNLTTAAQNLVTPNLYTTVGQVLRPTTVGVNYIIKY